MKKQYIAPAIKLAVIDTENDMLAVSNGSVKIDGKVYNPETGQYVSGTDWAFKGDGNENIVPEGKDNGDWSFDVWE